MGIKENPNNHSANLYDIVFRSLRPLTLTDEEISLITSRLDKSSKILDVGGGTGRHALLLAGLGYEVTVVDSSEGMITNLLSKAYKKDLKIKTLNKDIFEAKLKDKEYDMCVLFWNSFNEIALNKKHAHKLFLKLKNSLKPEGSIIINIDDSTKVDPSSFNFNSSTIFEGNEYKVHWESVKFFKKSNTSISHEQIIVFDKKGKAIQQSDAFIKQRYWSLNEIKELCEEEKLRVNKLNIRQNGELYLEIQ